jgi:hypothetical protein
MEKEKHITQQLLKELFFYDNGTLFWKITGYGVNAGDSAGRIAGNGYLDTGINNQRFKNHRLIFCLHHGYFPEVVDHIDGNPLNNKIENLRECSKSQNMWNSKKPFTNTSGHKGVSWSKTAKKWEVYLKKYKKKISFGYFHDFELACLVSDEAKLLYHGKFAKF